MRERLVNAVSAPLGYNGEKIYSLSNCTPPQILLCLDTFECMNKLETSITTLGQTLLYHEIRFLSHRFPQLHNIHQCIPLWIRLIMCNEHAYDYHQNIYYMYTLIKVHCTCTCTSSSCLNSLYSSSLAYSSLMVNTVKMLRLLNPGIVISVASSLMSSVIPHGLIPNWW